MLFSWETARWNRWFHALELPPQLQYLQPLEAENGKQFGALHLATSGHLGPGGQELAE